MKTTAASKLGKMLADALGIELAEKTATYPRNGILTTALLAALTNIGEHSIGEYTGLGSGGAVTVSLDFDPVAVLIVNRTDSDAYLVIKTASGLVGFQVSSVFAATVGSDIGAISALSTTAVSVADASGDTGSGALANQIKAKFNTLLTEVGTIITELTAIRTFVNALKADAAGRAEADVSSQITFGTIGQNKFVLTTTTANLNVVDKVYSYIAFA